MAKKRSKPVIEVEDHGNGFMVIGTALVHEASQILTEYVDNPGDYRFACPNHYEGRSAVWFSTEPLAAWDGATDGCGNAVR
jgi:hypothetical protein